MSALIIREMNTDRKQTFRGMSVCGTQNFFGKTPLTQIFWGNQDKYIAPSGVYPNASVV